MVNVHTARVRECLRSSGEGKMSVSSFSLKWPENIDLRAQFVILEAFKRANVIGYSPNIEVEPKREIVRYAHIAQEKVRERAKGKGDYIPDLLGFYRCKAHFDGQAYSGIYLFVDKIVNYAKAVDIDVNNLFLAVFYHEFGHLIAHRVALHVPMNSFDERNFEEPFCELLAYYAVFERKSPKIIKILNKDVSGWNLGIVAHGLFTKRVSKDKFVYLGRAYPYKWFQHFVKLSGNKAVGAKQMLSLSEVALAGTLLACTRKSSSCDPCGVFLINNQPVHEHEQAKAKRALLDFEARLIAHVLGRKTRLSPCYLL
jgi:hypothetical protein